MQRNNYVNKRKIEKSSVKNKLKECCKYSTKRDVYIYAGGRVLNNTLYKERMMIKNERKHTSKNDLFIYWN